MIMDKIEIERMIKMIKGEKSDRLSKQINENIIYHTI